MPGSPRPTSPPAAPATMSLDPDSHLCLDCGTISVPTDDRSAPPADLHVCPDPQPDGHR